MVKLGHFEIARRYVVLFFLAAATGGINLYGFDAAKALGLQDPIIEIQHWLLLSFVLGSGVVGIINGIAFKWRKNVDVNSMNTLFGGFDVGAGMIFAASLLPPLSILTF